MVVCKINQIRFISGYRHTFITHKPVIPTHAVINIGEVLLDIKNEISQIKQELKSIHARLDRMDATLNARLDRMDSTVTARIDSLSSRVTRIISGTVLGCMGIAASLATIYRYSLPHKQ